MTRGHCLMVAEGAGVQTQGMQVTTHITLF